MTVEKIKDFAMARGFVQINPMVRQNTNGYPFLTFINKDNVAENIYFSKTASKSVTVGQVVTNEVAKTLQIGYTKNEAGEERIKLISNSQRVDIADLFE